MKLKNDVIDELKWEPMINDTTIKVEVKDGVVTLSGYAGSLREKLDAELAAESVFGVIGVVQKIEVKLPSVAERGDEDISKQSKMPSNGTHMFRMRKPRCTSKMGG